MKARYHITFAAVSLLTSVIAQPAGASDRAPRGTTPEATSDPLEVIYRISGVRDNGGAENAGTATVFHCTNFNTVTDNLRIQILNFNGAFVADHTRGVTAKRTVSLATHGTVNIEDLPFLSPGTAITQGYAIISSTTRKMICSAVVVNASSGPPAGHDLHLVRFAPLAGSQE